MACDRSLACLLFGAYMEGTGYNKLLDIRNRCDMTVDLAAYQLVSCANGCTEWEYVPRLVLDGALPPSATWRVTDVQAPEALRRAANQTVGYMSNGNDAFGLLHAASGQVVDTVGEVGPDPGAGWAVAGTAGATRDGTLVRKARVRFGNCADWAHSAGLDATSSEWEVYPKDAVPSVIDGEGVDPSWSWPAPPPPAHACPPRAADCASGLFGSDPGDSGADRRADKSMLTVGTYNAEWLFDGARS